jgi:hypothetical protein
MNNHDPDRRTLLRGMLAVCCAPFIPGLAGCERKVAEEESATPSPAVQSPESMEPAAPSPEAAKMTKVQAEYQDQPKAEQNCEKCRYFIADSGTCQLVEGEISPQGWCKLWVAQETPAAAG